jgi:FkbM family methyltransferase
MQLLFSVIPQLAVVFSGKRVVFCIRILLQLYYFVFTRKVGLVQKDFALPVYIGEKMILLHLQRPMDLAGFREAFVDGEYMWELGKDFSPLYILDLGAHIGDSALYYHSCFPKATIIAVEPSEAVFKRLKQNTKTVPQIIPVQAAVGQSNGEVSLYVGESSLGSSLIKKGTKEGHEERVRQVTIDTLCTEFGIGRFDLIKFDIEGGEFSVFSTPSALKHADRLIGELHFDLTAIDRDQFLSNFAAFNVELLPIRGDKRYILKALRKIEKV